MRRRHSFGYIENPFDLKLEPIEDRCQCSYCGFTISRKAAVPCLSIPCPQCGTPMVESKPR